MPHDRLQRAFDGSQPLSRFSFGPLERDPEQEVQGMALPVLDAVVSQAREWRPSDPVLDRVSDVISPAAVEAGEPIRAVDALLVVDLLFSTLKPRRMPRSAGV